MTKPKLPKDFIALSKKVTAKRPRTVIEHILKLGAAEPQPNRKENSRGGAETQRKDTD